MKPFYSIIPLLFIIAIQTGCSKDFLKSYDRRIVGTWRITDINRNGLGGTTENLPFQSGSFQFAADGGLVYTDAAGVTYNGNWNIEKSYYDDNNRQSLHITVMDFTNQQVRGEYYDDINFTSTNKFKARIYQGLHTFITKFER